MKEQIRIAAVMVTFNPELATVTNVALLLQQVEELIVVDNGSTPSSLTMLREARDHYAFTLIDNEANMGIAAALNLGVRLALQKGYQWVLLFDQDSTVTDGFAEAMLEGYRAHPSGDTVAIFCPHYVDRVSGAPVETTRLDGQGGPIVAMTSGSLMPAWVFGRCGWFMEELFVDQVDVEYCFRVRAAGYGLARCPQARLVHSAGSPRMHRVWPLGRFRATHHSALRRYYITRNRLWVARQYRRLHPRWCTRILWTIGADTIKLLLVEHSRVEKLWSTLRGIRDGWKATLGERIVSQSTTK
ncbi:MAG TPA: glycosyltransferase family 2 protein [Acidisarcina sp.]